MTAPYKQHGGKELFKALRADFMALVIPLLRGSESTRKSALERLNSASDQDFVLALGCQEQRGEVFADFSGSYSMFCVPKNREAEVRKSLGLILSHIGWSQEAALRFAEEKAKRNLDNIDEELDVVENAVDDATAKLNPDWLEIASSGCALSYGQGRGEWESDDSRSTRSDSDRTVVLVDGKDSAPSHGALSAQEVVQLIEKLRSDWKKENELRAKRAEALKRLDAAIHAVDEWGTWR